MARCDWSQGDSLYIAYHDEEWGVPVYDDRILFEMLILEGMQAGLNWLTILRKRESFRQAFDNFDPILLKDYSDEQMDQLLLNKNIIRNKSKVYGVRQNARAFLKLQEQYAGFHHYLWGFVHNSPIQHSWKISQEVPTVCKESEALSKDLKKQGFTFVGATICYAYMQAVGLVNDHLVTCFRHKEVSLRYTGT